MSFNRQVSLLVFILMFYGCNNEIVRENKPVDEGTGISQIAKLDIDNVLDVHIRESRRLLRELMIKLYKRNPRELKKYGINITRRTYRQVV